MSDLKYRFVFFPLLLLAIGCSSVTRRAENSFQIREYKEVTLPNGLTVLFFADQSLPRVSFQLMVKTGANTDPAKKEGLNFVASQMIGRQTNKYSTNELSDEYGALGTEFNSTSSTEYTRFTSVGLSIYKSELLNLFAHTVTQPRFEKAELEKVKELALASIKRRPDDPGSFLTALMRKRIHGEHAYGHPANGYAHSVKPLRRRDVIRHYLRYFRPNNAILAVVGKFSADFEKEVTQKFSAWEKRPIKPIADATAGKSTQRELIVVDKPDLRQTQIRVAQLGIERSNENFLVARAANTVLGGAFVSRLNSRIRDELGLSYGASSYFTDGKQRRDFIVSTFTKHESVAQVIAEIEKILRNFKQNGISETELKDAKALMLGRFPQSIETPDRLAFNVLVTKVWGVKPDYLSQYINDVEGIELDQVNSFIKQFFEPEKMSFMILTSKSSIDGQFEKSTFSNKRVVSFERVVSELKVE